MIAVDTNVLVRLLTRDDETQAQRAADLFREHRIYIPKTVLLETEWVLRFSYRMSRDTILEAFTKLLGLPQVTVEDPPAVLRALEHFATAMDFADALHLASANPAHGFASFDAKLIKQAPSSTKPLDLNTD